MGKIDAETRKRSATIVQKKRKKGQKYRFPMPDDEHARLALQMMGKAKGLSAEDKAKIRRRAVAMLGNK